MALQFNAGTDLQITATLVTEGYYLTGDPGSWYSYYTWLNEPLQPFDISPLIRAFVSDNTKYLVPIVLIASSSQSYAFHISELNDIITVSFGEIRSGTFYNTADIYSCPIGSINTPFYIYFLYGYRPNFTTPTSTFMIAYREVEEVICSIGDDDNGRYGLLGETGSMVPITRFTPTEQVYDPVYYSPADFTTIPKYYNTAPKYGFTNDLSSSGGRLINTFTHIENLESLNGDPGEPVTPIPPEPDPDEPFDPTTPESYPVTPPTPDTSDTINIPGNPLIGVSSAGFINVYNPGINDLTGLGDILFPNVASATDVQDAILKVCQALQNQNLINYIIDCHVIPVTPQTGSNANIKVGFRDTGISVPVVTNDYIDATCGSLSLPEFFQGYQDYAATRSKIYLPFIGFVDTKPEYWQAGTISVDYKFNVIDGSFMCYIRSVSSKSALNGSVIAQYSGNACMHFPVTGVNYANMVSGIIGTAAAAASTGGASAVLGAAASAVNTIMKGGDVQQSNGYNSTAAMMGVREAFLLIERAVPAFPAYYGHDKGYPSNITTSLAAVSGFTTIEDIDLTGVPLTQVEIDELRGLLKEGVYF